MLIKYYKFLAERLYASTDYARSPLDIPVRTVFGSLLFSMVFCFITGSLFLFILYQLSLGGAGALKIPLDSSEKNSPRSPLITTILPQWERDWANWDTVSKAEILKYFPKSISSESLTAFVSSKGNSTSEEQINEWIVGDFSLLGFDVFPEDTIAKYAGLEKSYSANVGQKDATTWYRAVFVSSVQLLRSKLSEDISKPRRLLQALSGVIQWITFISAIWCLTLLLALRWPWAKMQQSLIEEGKLPFRSSNTGSDRIVWEDDEYKILENAFPRMFLASRLIGEVKSFKEKTDQAPRNLIANRINAFRDSVEIGEYEIINFLLWAAPTFGFIGTIFGIIQAMEKAGTILRAIDPTEQAAAMDQISSSLGTAFDTSLIALVWLVPMSYALARVRKAESNLFEELEDTAIRKLVNSGNSNKQNHD